MRIVVNLVRQALLFTVLFSCSFLPAIATITNKTIDDTFGDPFTGQKVLFLPTTPGIWKGANCTDCLINPDTTLTNQATYTAATYHEALGSVNFTLNFHGTAIYVFFILANNARPGVTTFTAANFTLDNQPPQLKIHTPDPTTTDLQYNVLVYSQTGLPAAQHSLLVSTSGDNDVYVNFDYAIYTHDDAVVVAPTSSSPTATATATASSSTPSIHSSPGSSIPTSSNRPTTTPSQSKAHPNASPGARQDNAATSKVNGGAIAGGVIGTLLAIGIIVAVVFLIRRRRKRLDTEHLIFKKVEIDPAEPTNAAEVGHSNPGSESGHSMASMNPFHHEMSSSSSTRLTLQVPNHRPPPMSQVPVTPSEAGDPYGGYVTPTSASVTAHSNPFSNHSAKEHRRPLQLVNRSSAVPTLASSISNHEDLRRERQEELTRQLAEMHQEMLELSSGLDCHASGANGEEAGCSQDLKRISVKSLRHLQAMAGTSNSSSSSSITAIGGPDGDAEIRVEDMKELIRSLRLQIEYLQLQQQSAWAQGLSDDPPPGYTPMVSRRLSSLTTGKH